MRHLGFALAPWILSPLLACSSSTEAPPDPGEPEFGAACDADAPCSGGLSCITTDFFPGGYCSALCEEESCASDASCVSDYGLDLCLADCAADSDCRTGYQCWRGTCRPPCPDSSFCGGGDSVCEDGRCRGPACEGDADCPPGRVCESGRCVGGGTADAGPGRDAGTPDCTAGRDCPSGICLPPDLGGRCADPCVDRASCASGALVCSPVRVDTDGDGTFDVVRPACLDADPSGRFLAAACSSDAMCESRACQSGQCVEVCDDDADCLLGQVCRELERGRTTDGRYSGCGYPARSGPVDFLEVDLGVHDVVSGFPGSRINFGSPNDAVSVTLMIEQISAPPLVPLTFTNVWTPDERRIFDLLEISMLEDQPLRWIPSGTEDIATMLIPNSTTDRLRFERGRYGVVIGAFGDGERATVQLRALIKRAPGGDMDAGVLTLNVWLVGVGLTEAQARTHTRLQDALSEVGRILGRRGVSVGGVNYRQITGADATRYQVIDSSEGPDSELSGLFTLSESRSNSALDVFLVRSIAAGAGESGGIALGIAGGIPGPPGVHGTIHSGVVVSFDTSVVGTDHRNVAQIMAHEIGHYLGLFHVRERSRPCRPGEEPSGADPCAPFGGEDVLADTSRGDGDNLMYFALGGADGRTYNVALSNGQGYVMRRHALVAD